MRRGKSGRETVLALALRSASYEDLSLGIRIALGAQSSAQAAESFTVRSYLVANGGIALYGGHRQSSYTAWPGHNFPSALDATLATEMVWAWLADNPPPNSERSGGDGSDAHGFFLHTDDSPHPGVIDALVVVKPVWLYYGK